MSRDAEPNEILEIVKGFLILLLFHAVAGVIIFALGFIVSSLLGGYSGISVWVVGAMGFFVWQMLYVVPLTLWLRRRGKVAMIKGVTMCAVITALLNGACFLSFVRN